MAILIIMDIKKYGHNKWFRHANLQGSLDPSDVVCPLLLMSDLEEPPERRYHLGWPVLVDPYPLGVRVALVKGCGHLPLLGKRN